MKRINIGLPEDVHTNAKAIAALKGTTMASFILEALNLAIERDRHIIERFRKSK